MNVCIFGGAAGADESSRTPYISCRLIRRTALSHRDTSASPAAPAAAAGGGAAAAAARAAAARAAADAAAAAAAARATAALGPANTTRVAGLLAEVAADALLDDLQDKAAAARVTALGALQLDRDVRALRGALAAAFAPGDARPDAALNAAVREGLGVASHAATLLGLEDPKEAADVVSKFVMPEDLPPILALRWGDASP